MQLSDVLAGRGQNVEDMLAGLLAGDAADSEEAPAADDIGAMLAGQMKQQKSALAKEQRLIAKVLWHSEDGRKVLQLLADMTVNAPTWPRWAHTDAQMLTLHGVGREYQNELVRELLRVIGEALRAAAQNSQDEDDPDDV